MTNKKKSVDKSNQNGCAVETNPCHRMSLIEELEARRAHYLQAVDKINNLIGYVKSHPEAEETIKLYREDWYV